MPSVDTPAVRITEATVRTLVDTGGYVHPLFAPGPGTEEPARAVPLPGQGVLLLMGGLVEQSGALDDAVALVELRRVRFHRMLTAGDGLRVVITPLESRTTSSGRLLRVYSWSGVDLEGAEVVSAEAVMLMNDSAQEGQPCTGPS